MTACIAVPISAAESVERCGTLAMQLQADAAVGLSRVQDMQRVYSGRATSMLDWDDVAENAATGFSAVVFLSGSVNGGTRSVHTLSTGLKAGSLAINGADILVDVGPSGSCIVAGQGGGVTLNQSELQDYLPGGDRTALANADAHLKATLVGASATLEVDDGKLAVGKTGYIYFADFDRTRERDRKCSIIVIGE